MKKTLFAVLLALSALSGSAQQKEWFSNVRLSGYGMAQYQCSDQEGSKSNTFNLRLLRLSLDGRILNDFYWKTQIQFNGNTSTLGSSPRVVDLFAEWQKYDFFKVKIGQYKRPFTFENPMHPIDQGFMGVGQAVSKLAGFSDRSGEQPSNGRDMGLQIQGDFLKNAAGRHLLHYQLGLFNGQGINTKDVDQRKDLIGGLWVMPVAGMRLGVFGWEGSVARKGKWLEGTTRYEGIRSLPKHRYAISGEYKFDDWTLRSEYVHSTGRAFAKPISNTNAQDPGFTNCEVNETLGSKADGFYGLVIAPVVRNKLHVKARYDLYRPSAEWGRARTQYEVGADYLFDKNFQINLEYARINDRGLKTAHNYNVIDVEVDFRF